MPRKNVNVSEVEELTPYLDWEEDANAIVPMPKIKKGGEIINKYTDALLNTCYEVVTPDNKIMLRLGELGKGRVTLTSQRWEALCKYLCNTVIVGIKDNDPDLIERLREEALEAGENPIEPLGDWAEEKDTHLKLLIEEEELTNRFLEEYNKLYGYTEKKTEDELNDS